MCVPLFPSGFYSLKTTLSLFTGLSRTVLRGMRVTVLTSLQPPSATVTSEFRQGDLAQPTPQFTLTQEVLCQLPGWSQSVLEAALLLVGLH